MFSEKYALRKRREQQKSTPPPATMTSFIWRQKSSASQRDRKSKSLSLARIIAINHFNYAFEFALLACDAPAASLAAYERAKERALCWEDLIVRGHYLNACERAELSIIVVAVCPLVRSLFCALINRRPKPRERLRSFGRGDGNGSIARSADGHFRSAKLL